jgi:hypothetical protein
MFTQIDNCFVYIGAEAVYVKAPHKSVKRIVFPDNLILRNLISDYVLRKDRCAILSVGASDILFFRNYKIYKFNLVTNSLEILYKINLTRTIFQTAFVRHKGHVVFFDYHSSGSKTGINVHISRNNGETWMTKKIFSASFCQRVISAHLLPDEHSILVSTGDSGNDCKLVKIDLHSLKWESLYEGSENFRFMNLINFSCDSVAWISNNRVDGPHVVELRLHDYSISVRDCGFTKKANIWHSCEHNGIIFAAETEEPVKFRGRCHDLKIYSFDADTTGCQPKVIFEMKISWLKRLLRFPSIDLYKTSGKVVAKISGTISDGYLVYKGGKFEPLDLLEKDLSLNGPNAIRSWSVQTNKNYFFWSQLIGKKNIKTLIGKRLEDNYTKDFRLTNIYLKIRDLL